jgi:hypothetical protein
MDCPTPPCPPWRTERMEGVRIPGGWQDEAASFMALHFDYPSMVGRAIAAQQAATEIALRQMGDEVLALVLGKTVEEIREVTESHITRGDN